MVFAGSLSSNEARQLKQAKDAERSTLINKTKDRLEKAGFRIFPTQNGSSSPAAAATKKGGNEGENATRNGGGRRDLSVYLHATASEIVKNIESDKWTATEVVSAYIRQAIDAHERTNCLTEILFEEALKEAEELDAEYASTKKLRGPLHGIPVSFKDQFEIKGHPTTIGFSTWASKGTSQTSAHLVHQFRSQGAIIIAKTNVPQTMLSFECSNPLFGRTLNPWSKGGRHTCGGSSGGEAALLAQNGSALGVGSDIGGSLRIPTGYCGIYSLKPSALRLSRDGAKGPCPGFEAIPTVMGPMARSVDDVELACRTLFGLPGATHELLPSLPYRDPKLPNKLRFGYYTSDLIVKASPASKRAVLETVEALKKQGHECIEFEPTLAFEALKLFVGLTSADGYSTLLSHLGPDPKESSLFLVALGPKVPGFVKGIASWIIRNILGDPLFSEILVCSKVRSTKEFYTLVAERDRLRKRFYEDVWDKYHFDGIIAPIQATPAVPHGATKTLSPLACGTILYNIIDSPVGVVPVTRVNISGDGSSDGDANDAIDDSITQEWKDESGHGSKLIENEVYFKKMMKLPNVDTTKTKSTTSTTKSTVYDAEQMSGLPVSVQIVGRSFEDEKVIEMMRVVDDALALASASTDGEGDGEKRQRRRADLFGPGAWPPLPGSL